jgi:AcrR family transcriptional regulator
VTENLEPTKRRDEIAKAVFRVLAREGAGVVSIRTVAKEAGCTRGAIVHHFQTRERLLLYACRYACNQSLGQIADRRRNLLGEAALRATLLEEMALSVFGRQPAAAWFGLLALAVTEPSIAAEFARYYREASTALAEMISEMVAAGEASAQIDPEIEAEVLLAFHLQMNLNQLLRPDVYTLSAITARVKSLIAALRG